MLWKLDANQIVALIMTSRITMTNQKGFFIYFFLFFFELFFTFVCLVLLSPVPNVRGCDKVVRKVGGWNY